MNYMYVLVNKNNKISSLEKNCFFDFKEAENAKKSKPNSESFEIKKITLSDIEEISNNIDEDIEFGIGKHALYFGLPQSGKMRKKFEIALKALKKGLPTVVLFRNFNVDYILFKKRLNEFNKSQNKKGLPLLSVPHNILDEQELENLLFQPNIILGLANPTTLLKINRCLEKTPELKNKLIIILDEADLNTFELDCNWTKTEEQLRKSFPNIYMLFSFTGTPYSILLSDKITDVFAIKPSEEYYGIDKLTHVSVNPKRSSIKGQQYDPEADSENLNFIMNQILEKPTATLLISASKLTKEHKNIIDYISSQYQQNEIIYMEMNENAIKIYNKFGKLIDSVYTKVKNKSVATIDAALQKYINCPYIVIVSGILAGRGISFVSCDYSRHLTHHYFADSPSMHLESALQSIRLQGQYKDNPILTLYCSDELYKNLLNQQKEITNIINLVKKARENKDEMPKIIEMICNYNRDFTSKRKEKGISYRKIKNNNIFFIGEYDEKTMWKESILLNISKPYPRSILKNSWPAGDDSYDACGNIDKERVIYFNPLSDFTPEGIKKIQTTPYAKKATIEKLLEKGYPYLEDLKELYRQHPDWEGKVLRRRKQEIPDNLIRK